MLKQWNRAIRSLRRRRQNRWAVEQLEDRSLLSAVGFDQLEFDATSYSDSQIIVQFDPDGYVNPNDLPLQGMKLGGSLGSAGLYEVYLDPSVTPEAAVAAFEAEPSVEYAHPDFTVQVAAIPNDPQFNSLWGMNNTGQTGGTADADIDAAEAWDVRTDASDVIVAVIDTGVDYTHPDLADNMWTNPGEIAGNGIDDDDNGFVDDVFGYDFFDNDADPMDGGSHGTHVAGTIGAVGNNGVGVAGVAWDVQIMALRFLGPRGGSTTGAIRAINYATQMGADIANNSWGGGGFNQGLQNAINNFTNNGGIFAAAAGNHGGNNDERPFYPANYNNVISVAASDHNDNKAGFSGFGKNTVDIAAPGVSIRSTIPNNRYANFNGTSMATPMVAGAFAVLKAEFPDDTNSELIDRMMLSADPVLDDVTTYGRLNLNEALKDDGGDGDDGDTTGPKVESAEWSGAATGSVDTVTVTFDESLSAATFTAADVTLNGPNGSITVDSVTEVAGSDGKVFEVEFASQSDAGDYDMDLGPDIEDLAGNLMDQDMDGTGGEAGDDVFSTSYSIEDVKVFEWSGNRRLRDARTRRGRTRRGFTAIRLDVTERVKIADLDVEVTINHTWDSDLAIYLYGGGKRTLLFNRRGGDGDNVYATFDDEADTAIADGSAPFNGDFRPESSLSAFDGIYTDTTFYVVVLDLAPRDVGSILGFKLLVTPENEEGSTSFEDGGASPVSEDVRFTQVSDTSDEVLWTEEEQVRVPLTVVDAEPATVIEPEETDWRDDLTSFDSAVTADSQDLVFAAVDDAESFELFE